MGKPGIFSDTRVGYLGQHDDDNLNGDIPNA